MSELHELLLACHERIRRFTGGLLALCEPPASDERFLPTVQACLAYFEQALPLHAQDEDESLLPRLMALPGPPVVALEAMGEQHRRIEALQPRVCAALRELLAGEPLHEPELFRTFSALLREHIREEELRIFPRLEELSGQEQSRMVDELRARRRTA